MNLNSELVRLHKLYEERILSEREYEAAKVALIVRFSKQSPDQNRSGRGVRIVSLIFGVVLAVFGLLMSAGSLLLIADGDKEFTTAQIAICGIFFGVMPTILGLVLCFRRPN